MINRNIVADKCPQLPNNGNKSTIYESNYLMETVSEINGIHKLSGGTFPINFNIIDRHQRKYPGLMAKLKCETYKLFILQEGIIILNLSSVWIKS